jgi:hypothetical protein
MARILYCHPSNATHEFHIYTDLDFWDARRILLDLAQVKRNFGTDPPGDEFPTQVVADHLNNQTRKTIQHRIQKAIVSPPRHVIVSSILDHGFFEFDTSHYYPARWGRERMMYFTYRRLPMEQSALNSPHRTVRLDWVEGKIRVQRVQREEKYDPVIHSKNEAERRHKGPLCF